MSVVQRTKPRRRRSATFDPSTVRVFRTERDRQWQEFTYRYTKKCGGGRRVIRKSIGAS